MAIDTKIKRAAGKTENSIQLLLTDHLGSIHTIMDGKTMAVLQRQSFDPFGQRRNPTDWKALLGTQLTNFDTKLTTRGFTGHEQLDEVGLIHMNGRVYDPKLGRFLQADPFVQAAENTQSFNRYSYVLNNPLNAVDPSGYFLGKLWKSVKKFAGAIVGIVLTVWAPWGVGLWQSFIYGAIAGGVGAAANGGNILKGALVGGVSAAAFYGVAKGFSKVGSQVRTASNTIQAGKNLYLSTSNFVKLVFAQGAVGGVLSTLQGGSFGNGFLTAGVTKMATPAILSLDNEALESIASGVVGGTTSELTGGKFSNGAMSGAFLYAFNSLSSSLKNLWRITPSGTSKVMFNKRFGKFYKSKSDGLWWSKDIDKHGGSMWKVFEEDKKGLHWIKDADETGKFIVDKHKGDTGVFIPWKSLRTAPMSFGEVVAGVATAIGTAISVIDPSTYAQGVARQGCLAGSSVSCGAFQMFGGTINSYDEA